MAKKDWLKRRLMYDHETTPNTGDPTDDQIIELDQFQAQLAATLIVNVQVHGGSDSCTVQFWTKDDVLNGMAKSEKATFPPPGYTAPGIFAYKTDIAGQTPAITLPVITGEISLSYVLTDRKIGGN